MAASSPRPAWKRSSLGNSATNGINLYCIVTNITKQKSNVNANLSPCLIKDHAMKNEGNVGVYLQAFLIWALDPWE